MYKRYVPDRGRRDAPVCSRTGGVSTGATTSLLQHIGHEPPHLVGINHIALEVGSIDEALEFYGKIFSLTLRGRGSRMAFIDIGDQFIALAQGAGDRPDTHRHFGLVVDSKAATRRSLEEAGVDILPGRGLDFRDPWGNHVQIVEYSDIQFTKAPSVLRGMGLGALEKSPEALDELRRKGLAPD